MPDAKGGAFESCSGLLILLHACTKQRGSGICLRAGRCCAATDEEESDGTAAFAPPRPLGRACRIVLISGFESFNVDLYRKVFVHLVGTTSTHITDSNADLRCI